MKLKEEAHAYFIEGIGTDSFVTLGFTKPHIEGIHIKEDIKKIFPKKHIFCAYLKQLHSNKIVFVDKEGQYEGDGLITRTRQLLLVVRTADCLPLFVINKKEKLVAIIHIGWKGAKDKILNNLNIDFSSSCVVAGVGLRQCCYRVGEEFLTIKPFARFIAKKNNCLYLDIISFVKNFFLEKGTPATSFFDINICSSCSKYSLFSWRRNKTNKRTLSFIFLH